MTRKKLWILGGLVVVAVAAVLSGLLLRRNVDRAADFAFDGTVKSLQGAPLADTDVIFVDTGFDQSATKRQLERSVGRTDSDGRLSAKFSYRYGFSYTFVPPSPKQTFRLVFRRSGVGDVVKEFDATALPMQEGAILVRFEIVMPDRPA